MRRSRNIRRPVPRQRNVTSNPLRPWPRDLDAIRDAVAQASVRQLEAELKCLWDPGNAVGNPWTPFAMHNEITAELQRRASLASPSNKQPLTPTAAPENALEPPAGPGGGPGKAALRLVHS